MFDLISGYFFPLAFGFFVGSLPTTYALVKWRKRLDIREEGTGNVGTMNVYEVTASRGLGLAVLVIDVVKGAGAVLGATLLFGDGFWTGGAGGLGAMLGHNYSPWLRFRGGRGLAAGLGVSLVLVWVFACIWGIAYLVTVAIRRDIHTGNIAATIAAPAALAAIPAETLGALLPGSPRPDVLLLSVFMSIIILLGHFNIIVKFFKPSATHQ